VKFINDDDNLENSIEFHSMNDISKYLQEKRDQRICKLYIDEEEVL
jgi:hypothetical protein